jgi:hypothetical protein
VNPEHRLFCRWYRATPDWAVGDLEAITLLKSFRRRAFIGLAALVISIVVFIFTLVMNSGFLAMTNPTFDTAIGRTRTAGLFVPPDSDREAMKRHESLLCAQSSTGTLK